MFFGKFGHTIDEKGRLTIPSKYRETLDKGLVLTRGLDHCLYIFPMEEWERLSLKIQQLLMTDSDSRHFISFLFSEACDCVPDRQGRVVIPSELRDYAALDSNVVVTGSHNHLEIWNTDTYRAFKTEIESDPQGLAQRISGLGIL
jgi:MraZ protein